MKKGDKVTVTENQAGVDKGFKTTVVAVPGDEEYDSKHFGSDRSGLMIKPEMDTGNRGGLEWYWIDNKFVKEGWDES